MYTGPPLKGDTIYRELVLLIQPCSQSTESTDKTFIRLQIVVRFPAYVLGIGKQTEFDIIGPGLTLFKCKYHTED